MNKNQVSTFFGNVKKSASKNAPGILTGLGIAGMITTTILAVRATPKAIKLIEVAEDEKGAPLTVQEKVKTCWKCYIPATLTGAVSVGCTIGASSVNSRRNAALATAYKLSETALTEYRDKVVETIGEKKEKAIREQVAADKVDRHPISKSEVLLTEKGETIFFDVITSRYFKSDIEFIKRIINELNKRMLSEDYISLNDFYYEIGLEGTKIGEDIGWNITRGFIDVDFGTRLTADDKPCVVLDYSCEPRYGYDR